MKLSRFDLIVTMYRSLFVETVWNFERMQSVGFLYAIIPAIRKLYPNKIKRISALKRHLKPFSTHPYMTGIILGVILKKEEEIACGTEENTKVIDDIKSNMMGPLAALGDSFFWSAWRPLIALLGTTITMLSVKNQCSIILGPVVFLIIYNIPHFYLRCIGFIKAYNSGLGIISTIRNLNIQKLVERLYLIGAIMAGCVIALLFSWDKFKLLDIEFIRNIFFFSVILLLTVALKFQITATKLLYIIIIICTISVYFGF
ncbi:MAG: PTS system mannose/fructose/sorbose family transporter subunit IID [Candidatus Firestonebacteria bacterium]